MGSMSSIYFFSYPISHGLFDLHAHGTAYYAFLLHERDKILIAYNKLSSENL